MAVQRDPYQRGLYHEKLGIFRDVAANVVVFTGSANESVSGLIDNFECVDVFRSWRSGDDERIAEKLDDFHCLWENQTQTLEVLASPEAVRRSLLKLCSSTPLTREPSVSTTKGEYQLPSLNIETRSKGIPTIPLGLEIHAYQQQAIANWFVNQNRGTPKMATGSRKTITALALTTKLYKKSSFKFCLWFVPISIL